jgi:lipopolysaccharide/colanic/teichoic acid biosynthesis glycosyltransferase
MVIRIFDIIFSLLALIFLLPIFIPVMLILKFSGENEIFFFQERTGKDKKLFKLYKFATMLKNSPNTGTGTVTMKNDPRVLPVGKFLRKTKINELPQLLNVLFGDMSLIGPRPQTPRCFEAFPESMQNSIIKINPGLSGIGPIIFRAEEDILEGQIGNLDFYDNVIAPYKGEVESWYVDRRSLRIYFVLILLTVFVVIFPRSKMIWSFFKDLPIPPKELKTHLNYPH